VIKVSSAAVFIIIWKLFGEEAAVLESKSVKGLGLLFIIGVMLREYILECLCFSSS
jgi:hypothetical protein